MEETVYSQFLNAARDHPNLPFLCYPSSATRAYLQAGFEISYGASLTKADELARQYTEAGYRQGHRIALVVGNRPEHFWHLLALNSIGACVVTLNPEYQPHEMAYGIGFAECAAVIASPPGLALVEEVCACLPTPVPVIDATSTAEEFPAPAHGPLEVPAAKTERPALIIYTSGTTGKPKGCIISNASCLAAAKSYADAGGLLAFEAMKERLYIPLPAFHMNVSVYTLNSMIRLRSCLVMQDRFSVSSWWPDIAETKATCFHYMGIIPPLLLKQPVQEVEKRHCVKFGQGAGVDPAVREAFENRFGFPLIEAWGMTETSRAMQNCDLPRCLEPRAFGRPKPPLEVRIVDDEDRPLPFNTPGELLVRASGHDPRHGFFSGYLNLPEETERAWRGGWFHTGDIVSQRDDGMLFFVDRKKNIIRRSGENIAAAEIEEALQVLDQIKSVAVVAVIDEFHDEEVMACIVLMPGVEASAQTAEQILTAAARQLAWYKLPAWIAFMESVPVTGTQKIQKGLIFAEGADPRSDPRSIDMRIRKRELRINK